MCLAQGPQHSDAGEARTRGPSVSSQALYHWATALPLKVQVFSVEYDMPNNFLSIIMQHFVDICFQILVWENFPQIMTW